MRIKYHSALLILFLFFFIVSCSKKHHPQTEINTSVTSPVEKETKPAAAVRKEIKTPVPKVISVDDRAAKRAVDGRLYYDLEGHRYWKNYDDGKYYIFSSKMGGDPAYKPH